jgi:thioredoxin reductase
MALGRALRRVLIIDSGNPCNKSTPHSHNFLTNDGRTPGEIAELARGQVAAYDSVEFADAWASRATKAGDRFEVELAQGGTITARKLILATGIRDNIPAIPGFEESWGKSVLHCPYCHGYEVRERKTGVLATAEHPFEYVSLIANWTHELTLFTNGPSSLSAQEIKKLEDHKITMVTGLVERLEQRRGSIESVVMQDGRTFPLEVLYARLPFSQHSAIPADLGCELTAEGYIKIDTAQETTVHGVFACGDNSSRMRTVANAVSTGTATGIMVNRELIEESF